MAIIKSGKIQVLFFGTPEFACPTLSVLLAQNQHFEVAGVVTQPDRPAGRDMKPQKAAVKQLAEEHLKAMGKMGKLPIFTPENVNTPESVALLEKLAPDLAVVVAYGQILKPNLLSIFKLGGVNVHASLLPRWRGAAPIAWALLNQDSVTGVCLQKIEQKLDSGAVIAKSELILDETWDAPSLYKELSRRGAELVRKHLPAYAKGDLKPTPQDETLVTYAPKITKEQGKVDWNKSAQQICAQLRALTPWPGTWTTRDGKILKILRADPVDNKTMGKPSEVVGADQITFWVQCGQNTVLKVGVVQPESRSRQAAAEYVRGYPFEVGDKLGT